MCWFAGCAIADAPNFDSIATRDDGSCIYPIYGCMNDEAINYRATANAPDECSLPGCMGNSSVAYDPEATFDDGSCFLAVEGCTDSRYENFWEAATHSRADSCALGGCTSSTATNFEPLATYDLGDCAELTYTMELCVRSAEPVPV